MALPGIHTDRAAAPPLRSIVALFAVAGVLALGASWLAGDLVHYWWHAGTLGAAFGILLLTRFAPPALRTAFGLLVGAYAGGLALLTILVGLGLVAVQGFHWGGTGVRLFFDNPNLLGAALVLSGLASLIVLPARVRGAIGIPLLGAVAVALLYTSAKTAFAALAVGVVLWLAVGEISRRVRVAALGSLVVVAALVGGVGAVSWQQAQANLASRNLLPSSGEFQKSFWVKHYAQEYAVTPNAEEAPDGSRTAARLHGVSAATSGLVKYPISIDSEGEGWYVASLYLRGDTPQQLVLATGQDRVACPVDSEWRRCVTPAWQTDNPRFRLLTLEPDSEFDFAVWGAQLEQGTAATELQQKTTPWLPPRLLATLNPVGRLQSLADDLAPRFEAMEVAWRAFLRDPVAGAGLNSLAGLFDDSQRLRLRHAHNLPLQLAAEAGLLGLLSWAIPLFGVLALAWRQHWRKLLPLVAALLLLNAFDATYYSNGVYYLYWLAVGLVLFGNREGGPAPQQA